MAQSQKEEIQKAFDKASEAVRELENTIRKYHDTPRENIKTSDFQRIRVPSGYIRTRSHYAHTYNLNYLINNLRERDSIAYSLMQSDLNNFFINRIHVWGIVDKLLLKGAIINLVSAIEGLLMCSLGNLHRHCKIDSHTVCKHQARCTFYIKSTKNLKIAGAIEILKTKLRLNDETVMTDITFLNGIRNNVHLPILNRHEFINDDYSINNYNKAIKVLKYLKAQQRASTEQFISSRIEGCIGLTRP